jgi:hypothetical protein
MGERSVKGERILGSYVCGDAYCVKDKFIFNTQLSDFLHSSDPDILKYFHRKPSEYNVCHFGLNLGGVLMFEIMKGEKKNGF